VDSKIRIKNFLSRRMPLVLKMLQGLHFVYLSRRSSQSTFTDIYRKNSWFGSESASGQGSTLKATEPLRRELLEVISDLKISSLLDAGCGDFNWMKEVELGMVDYTGVDVVDNEVIAQNVALYGSKNRHFFVADVTHDDLPRVDLILCRDVLTHLPNKKVLLALRQFQRSGSTYLMTSTHPHLTENADTFTGGYRELNLERPPFNLPAPLMLVGGSSGQTSKFGILGLWKLSEISLTAAA
jgi:SAM-dependent methyltransferase